MLYLVIPICSEGRPWSRRGQLHWGQGYLHFFSVTEKLHHQSINQSWNYNSKNICALCKYIEMKQIRIKRASTQNKMKCFMPFLNCYYSSLWYF
jgi:hypothetical protein